MGHNTSHSEEAKRKISESMKKAHKKKNWWKGRKHREETKVILKNRQLANWQNPSFRRTMGLAQAQRPTKEEKRLDFFLKHWYGDKWKYTGDDRLFIDNKNPDFVAQDGDNKIIELFGEYFHEKKEEKQYIKFYKDRNFKCLVIWVKEMDDLRTLKNKLDEFVAS